MRCAKLPQDSKLYHHVSITVSDDELETIDRLVSDSEIFEAYADTIFTEDDF